MPERTAGYVLVVDDEPDIVETTARLLGAHGIPVATARNGRDALALARSDPPAVVLLDLRMPVMSGEQFLAEWQADPALAAVSVVVCSATADRPARDRLPGVAAYLHKPADPRELLATVRRFLADG